MLFEKDEGQSISEKREWKKKKKVKVTEINQSKGKIRTESLECYVQRTMHTRMLRKLNRTARAGKGACMIFSFFSLFDRIGKKLFPDKIY